jgi:hypothetical protein
MTHQTIKTLLCVAVMLIACAPSRARTISDDNFGYSFDLPDDWVAIPQSAIDAMTRRMIAPGTAQTFAYVAAFQPKTNTRYFQYPYVLVQVNRYPNDQPVDSISEADLKQLAAAITGLSSDQLRKGFSAEAQKLVNVDGSGMTATYFTDPPGYQINVMLHTANFGPIQGVAYGRVGHNHLVSIDAFARQDDWDKYWPTFQPMVQGFHLSPAEQAPMRQADPYLTGGGIGVALILAGVVVYMIRQNKMAGARI